MCICFLDSAKWAYGWIAAFYPLGDKFVPAMLGVISACIAVTFIYLLIAAIAGDKLKSKKGITALNIVHTIVAVLTIILFVYTLVLVMNLDKGFSLSGFAKRYTGYIAGINIYLSCSRNRACACVLQKRKESMAGTCLLSCCKCIGNFSFIFWCKFRRCCG